MSSFLRVGGSALLGAILLGVAGEAQAQERQVRWQRQQEAAPVPVTVFHSTHAANLPTAETLLRGEWLFEISHRFFPAVADGAGDLWGFDGPVANRIGLSYAASHRLMIGILRTNVLDNLELNAKVRLLEREGALRWMVGAAGGWAVNTAAEDDGGIEANETQAYAQVMLNLGLGDGRVALGVVPGLLRNPRLQDVDPETVFVLGLHGQLYVSDQVSFLTEWIVSPERQGMENDTGTFGVELETGGHFFKIILTNQYLMNPTQVLAGTPDDFAPDAWRVGFNITRLLTF